MDNDGTRVIGLSNEGYVLLEVGGLVFHTWERVETFVDWYGLEDMNDDERLAIGIRIH